MKAAITFTLLSLHSVFLLAAGVNLVPEWSEWDKAAAMTVTTYDDPTEQECLAYLRKYAPPADRTSPNITAAFLLNNIQLALKARNATAWGRSVPKPLFLNEVLPYAMMAEPRGLPHWDWRPMFHKDLMPLVKEMPNASTAAEAGVNTLSWKLVTPQIKFFAAPNCEINEYAPITTLKAHQSSCTGLGIYVVAALRSVGIPARVVGTPHWNRCGGMGATCSLCPSGDLCTVGNHSSDDQCGNHDWAEVWVDGAWHFIDPDGDHRLDHGWFIQSTKLQTVHTGSFYNHSVVASSWAIPTSDLPAEYYPNTLPITHFPMVWDWHNHNIGGWDVTPRYVSKA